MSGTGCYPSPAMRIAVLSDIHSNLVALDAVLAHLGSVDAIWQLGDVVGYGPDPNGVVGRLAELGAVGVRGDHDAAAIGGSEIEWFNPEARAAVEWTRTRISTTTRSWLTDLPERLLEADYTLVHGSPQRTPLGVHHVEPGGPRQPRVHHDPLRVARPHPPAHRLGRGRRADS